MSAIARTSVISSATTRRPVRQLAQGVASLLDAWLERRRQRLALLEMSEHMLKDIGVSRADAYVEGSKPFWRP